MIDSLRTLTGLGCTKLGWLLGPSYKAVSLMSYWVLPKSGIPISRTIEQCVTHLETQIDVNRKHFEHYDTAITEIFHEVGIKEYFSEPSSDKPTMEMCKDLAGGDEDFQNKFARVFDNTNVKEDDDRLTPYSYDNYINMELALDQGGEQPKYVRVKKRLKDN